MNSIATLINRLAHRARSQSGFALPVLMGVMLAGGLFAVAALNAARGDIGLSGRDKDRKMAYGAAEAGLNWYSYQLNEDTSYWTNCATVPSPDGVNPAPVNQKWSGSGADTRRWRTLPNGARYTIELLPAPGQTSCQTGNADASMLDSQGMFRIRATGRYHGEKRSVIAQYRRRGFLQFIYFTDIETLDPNAYNGASNVTWANTNCAKYRALRDPSCQDIVFHDVDRINGPLHTNDDLLVCGSPVFGRDKRDLVEVSGPPPGHQASGGGCADTPQFLGTFRTSQPTMQLPTTNAQLKTLTQAAYRFTGKTSIRMNDTTMTVTNNNATQTLAWPSNGLVFVDNGTCGSPTTPIAQTYTDPAGCAIVYLSGTYGRDLTIASANDIVVAPTGTSTTDADIVRNGDRVLGLIANNHVRVQHRVQNATDRSNCGGNSSPTIPNIRVEAAILSLGHSFIVDNWWCGAPLANLTIFGAIAQRFRGPVGTFSGSSIVSGYTKNYTYDNRLLYRNPPNFLPPVAASWRPIRTNEQVPAT